MTSQPGICLKLMENNTFMTLAGMVMVLMTVALVVVGMGMSPVHMWLIMASIAVAWLSFCRCINWQRKATQGWATSSDVERRVPLDTISSGVASNMSGEGGRRGTDGRGLAMILRDAPPSYDSLGEVIEEPPSYSSVVAKLAPAEDVVQAAPCVSEVPPPYGSDSAPHEANPSRETNPPGKQAAHSVLEVK